MQPAKVAPNPGQVHFDFLVETVASNLHLHAIEVVTIAASVSAAVRSGDKTLLRSCRHLLGDNGKAMMLALKFGAEIGLSTKLVVRLNATYASVLDGKRALATIVLAGAVGPTHAQLQAQASWWRRAATDTMRVVELFDEAARGSLNAVYADDTRVVRQALQKAADGDESLIDRFGGFAVPKLRQRRQSPRLAVHRSATLHLSTGDVPVRVQDISREGLGIVCAQPLAARQELNLTLDNGAKVEAVVASARGTFYGLSLRTRLSQHDVLATTAG